MVGRCAEFMWLVGWRWAVLGVLGTGGCKVGDGGDGNRDVQHWAMLNEDV